MSFDFVDLDEDSLSDLKQFNNFPKFPQVSPLLASAEESNTSPPPTTDAIFIRSTSPINSETISGVKTLAFAEVNIPDIGTLRFNHKGPSYDGRDSQVFRGEITTTQSQSFTVAVKVYKNEQSALAGAQKEVQIARTITADRPDFLKLYHSGTVEISGVSEFVSVWEWIDGGTLDRIVSKLPDTQKVIKSLAMSVAHLHANNLAHHDLKPQNILVSSDYTRIILIDFGDSKLFDHDAQCHHISIDEGIGLGTLAYTAPELLSRKSSTYNPFAADVYSFGTLLFFLLNRGVHLPFQALIPHRAVQLILTVQKGFFAGGYNPEKPRDSPLYPLMLKCLQVDPTARPTFPEIINEIK